MKYVIATATLLALMSHQAFAQSGNSYDRNGRVIGTVHRQSDGSVVSNANGGERSVGTRTGYRTYGPGGQMTRYGIWHGKTMLHYSPDGRYLGRSSVRNGLQYHHNADGTLRSYNKSPL